MPVAFSIEELVRLVELQLKNPVAAAQSRHQWLAQWDYASGDWQSRLTTSFRMLTKSQEAAQAAARADAFE
jgi:hypothetical protein